MWPVVWQTGLGLCLFASCRVDPGETLGAGYCIGAFASSLLYVQEARSVCLFSDAWLGHCIKLVSLDLCTESVLTQGLVLSDGLNVKYYHFCLFCAQSSSDRVMGASSSRSRLASLTCVHHSLADFKSLASPALPIPAWSQPFSRVQETFVQEVDFRMEAFYLCWGVGG